MNQDQRRAEWIRRCRLTPKPDQQISEFLSARTASGEAESVRAGALYEAFTRYAAEREWLPEFVMTGTAFGRTIAARNRSRRDRHGRHYIGLSLAADRGAAR